MPQGLDGWSVHRREDGIRRWRFDGSTVPSSDPLPKDRGCLCGRGLNNESSSRRSGCTHASHATRPGRHALDGGLGLAFRHLQRPPRHQGSSFPHSIPGAGWSDRPPVTARSECYCVGCLRAIGGKVAIGNPVGFSRNQCVHATMRWSLAGCAKAANVSAGLNLPGSDRPMTSDRAGGGLLWITLSNNARRRYSPRRAGRIESWTT